VQSDVPFRGPLPVPRSGAVGPRADAADPVDGDANHMPCGWVVERRERLGDLAAAAGAPEPTALADGLLLLMDGAFAAARMYGRSGPAARVATAARTLIDAHLPAKKRARATGRRS
jgi:hypothetical protein